MSYNEDNLTQKTMSDYMEQTLGWENVFAFNTETFGVDGTLGRKSDREIVLTRYLRQALVKFNPKLPDVVYDKAITQVTDALGFQSIVQTNRDKYNLIRDGIMVSHREKGETKKIRLRVFDFNDAENNHFLCVRELWVRGTAHRRRPDIIGYVNGLPLLFVECKRPDKSLRRAYNDNISDYKDTIPHAFNFNAMVMLSNGVEGKIGSITAKYEHYSDWKRLKENDKGTVQMEQLLKGVCDKANFMDIFENFILFDDSGTSLAKIVARNHQYLGVNRALEAVRNREARDGKLGVFWHTQGSGKSYSMAFFAQKVRRKIGGDFTFLLLTDRNDLDSQIYKTFAGVGLANNDKEKCRAESGEELKTLLSEHKAFVFTLVQKFNQEIAEGEAYSTRKNIIVMTDEAHRTQYGQLALNMRNALPNANFMGFTGTPLFKDDEMTKRIFGGYVSTYGFQRAIEDNATLPLYYDARGDKLQISSDGLNEKIAKAIEDAEIEDVDVAARLENELKREYHVVTAENRLRTIAKDFAHHFSTNWEAGKAMYVALDKVTAVRMHGFIGEYWQDEIKVLKADLKNAVDEQDLILRQRQIEWMLETEMAVVVSDEQGEVDKFRKWDLDIIPHRKRMREGFTLDDGKRVDVETAFKREEHPFRIVIVCAMWLTGFDVPSLSTLYLDKPLQAHTLMQAIARANRVKEGKNNGLIVDYCGILKNLRKALATFAGHTGTDESETGEETDPLHPEEELLAELAEAIAIVKEDLSGNGFALDKLHKETGFEKNAALVAAKEAININDETRKMFEISARAVFRKYKACLTFKGVVAFKEDFAAIRFIYNILEDDRVAADTSVIIRKLNEIVSQAITVQDPTDDEPDRVFDISKINFELLKKEFEKSPNQNTDVQNLRSVIEKRLNKMLMENPIRTDFQLRFNEIISEYNLEKDKNTIEQTFEALMRLTAEMHEEELAYAAEGFENQEQKTIFDMLVKPNLSKSEIKKIKKTSVGLLQTIRDQLESVQGIFAKESTRDGFRQNIYDFLYSDQTGLPADSYGEVDLALMTDNLMMFFANRSSHPGGSYAP